MHISDLTGLSDPLAMLKPLPTVICDSVHRILCQAAKHEEAGNGSARSTFPRVAVHYHYVLVVHYMPDEWSISKYA